MHSVFVGSPEQRRYSANELIHRIRRNLDALGFLLLGKTKFVACPKVLLVKPQVPTHTNKAHSLAFY